MRLWLTGLPFLFLVAGTAWQVILLLVLALYGGYSHLFARADWRHATRKHYFAAAAGFATSVLPFVLVTGARMPQKTDNVLSAVALTTVLLAVYRRLGAQPMPPAGEAS